MAPIPEPDDESESMIDLQLAVENTGLSDPQLLVNWAQAVLDQEGLESAITLRVVDEAESQSLNYAFRHKDKPTNVLSFPFENPPGLPPGADLGILGDLVICAAVVKREAKEQGKTLESHWAHMIVHGLYHLQGYDHETEVEAQEMEALEIKMMQRLGFANPYE